MPWWSIKPKQSAPPRQELMHPPGEVARFVTDQALYSSKVRSGRSTQLGGELDLPQVRRGEEMCACGIIAMCYVCVQDQASPVQLLCLTGSAWAAVGFRLHSCVHMVCGML